MLRTRWKTGVVAHAFNPALRRISEFEASLVYKVSPRTARATQRNPVSKNKNKKTIISKVPRPRPNIVPSAPYEHLFTQQAATFAHMCMCHTKDILVINQYNYLYIIYWM